MSPSPLRALVPLALALTATLTLTACAASGPVQVTDATVIVDVRTPAEYSEGHLQGALNIDVQSPAFADGIAGLDPAGEYVVYCRSGNRSATAVKAMRDAGFTGVTDAGGMSSAAESTGLEIVTGP
ncbi:rhodanese-like domain-containing protein [Microbacterium sp.]|uniref:rhodanese-like domain-containing protein n=1 Tax=Microbacterium sp. TaxID=51671 RepID=UPI003A878BE0